MDEYMGLLYTESEAGIKRYPLISRVPNPFKGLKGKGTTHSYLSATEITSMGLEFMWHDPDRLMMEDPELWDFLWDNLVGLVKGRVDPLAVD